MTALTVATAPGTARGLFPGVLACCVVAAASTFLSEHYGAPVMLFALLLGMAMNFLSVDGPCAPGIEFYDGKIAKWWTPDDVVFLDAIPLGATGKMQKNKLREMFRDYQLPLSSDR